MADDKNKSNADSQNGNEPTIDELIQQNNDAKDMESLRKLNTQVFARLKKAEEKTKDPQRNDGNGANGGADAGKTGASAAPQSSTAEDVPYRVYRKLENMGLDDAAIDKVAEEAKKAKIPVAEFIELSYVKAGLEAQRKQTRGRDNTPPPSGSVADGMIPSNDEIPGVSTAKNRKERYDAVVANSRRTFERRVQGKGGEDGAE